MATRHDGSTPVRRRSTITTRGAPCHCDSAIALAEAGDDLDVLAPATTLLVRSLITLGEGSRQLGAADRDALELAERADPRLDRWRAALFGVVAECRWGSADVGDGLALAQRARDAASAHPDPESVWAVELGEGLQHVAALRLDTAAACFAGDRRVRSRSVGLAPRLERAPRRARCR